MRVSETVLVDYREEVVCEASLAVNPVTKLVHVPSAAVEEEEGRAGEKAETEGEEGMEGAAGGGGRQPRAQEAMTRFSCLGYSTWGEAGGEMAGWGGKHTLLSTHAVCLSAAE